MLNSLSVLKCSCFYSHHCTNINTSDEERKYKYQKCLTKLTLLLFLSALLSLQTQSLSSAFAFFMTNAKHTLWICITICKVISHPVCFHLTHGFGYFYSFNNLVQDPSALPTPFSLHTILAAPKGTCTPRCTNAEELIWTSQSKFTKSVSVIHKSHSENWEEIHFYGVCDERLDYCQVESLSWKQMLQRRTRWICWKGRKPICKLGRESN